MLAALGAGRLPSLGFLAARLALVGLFPLSLASGASLLVTLRPASMSVVRIATVQDIHIVICHWLGIVWPLLISELIEKLLRVCSLVLI
jgi:hypothetical protein